MKFYNYHHNIKGVSRYFPFTDFIVKCLMNDKNFEINTFLEHLQFETKNFIDMTHFWNGLEYIDLKSLENQLWSRVFLYQWGPCYTFDLSSTKEFEYIPYKEVGGPGIEFSLVENNPWNEFMIILHSKNDLPDGPWINGEIFSRISNETKEAHIVYIRKTISKREPTRKIPCTTYEHKTCLNIEDNRLVLEEFNCKIPILYNGKNKILIILLGPLPTIKYF